MPKKQKKIVPGSIEDLFREETWTTDLDSYSHDTSTFKGPEPGVKVEFEKVPSPLGLFHRFFTVSTLKKIVKETNRYALEVIREDGRTRGGLKWIPLTIQEFEGYLSIRMFMSLKKLPNLRLYWSRDQVLYHCGIVSSMMSRDRFESITRCLHLTPESSREGDKSDPSYDKIWKVRWLANEVRDACATLWNANVALTVDETMIRYKGKYCPIRQYMPKKPTKFGVKVWVWADSWAKYVLNFDVYCGASTKYGEKKKKDSGKGVGKQGRDVVKDLVKDLHHRGHFVVVDNIFTSIPLFTSLLEVGVFARGTARADRKGLPPSLTNKVENAKHHQGWYDFRFHSSGMVCCLVWMDKKPVLLLSTHALSQSPLEKPLYVWRLVDGERKKFSTSPIHLEYIKEMRGVDVADQLRGAYSLLSKSHKWWHRVFDFLLDTTFINSWIVHSEVSYWHGVEPLTHLDFHLQLAQQLGASMLGPRLCTSTVSPLEPRAHGTLTSKKRRVCIVCGVRTNKTCPGCTGLFICEGKCYFSIH